MSKFKGLESAFARNSLASFLPAHCPRIKKQKACARTLPTQQGRDICTFQSNNLTNTHSHITFVFAKLIKSACLKTIVCFWNYVSAKGGVALAMWRKAAAAGQNEEHACAAI